MLKATNLAQESQNELALYGPEIKRTWLFALREMSEKVHILKAEILLSLVGDSIDNLEGK